MSTDAVKGRLCRLCRCSNDVVLIHIFAEENAYILEEIELLITEKPTINDALPPYVCHRCEYKIKKVKEFRNLCIESVQQLQTKHVSIDEEDDDDVIVIIEERLCNTSQSGRNSIIQPRQINAKINILENSKDVDSDSHASETSNSTRRKHRRNYRLQNSKGQETSLLYSRKRQHSPETAQLLKQDLQSQYRPEVLIKTRKLQHGLIAGPVCTPSSTETLPEVVCGDLGTKGLFRTDGPGSSTQEATLTRRMELLRMRTEQLQTAKRSALILPSFSTAAEQSKLIRCMMCCGMFENKDILADHIVTRHVTDFRKKNNRTLILQPSPPPPSPQPKFSLSVQPLSRGYTEAYTCGYCAKVFTNKVIFKQHIRENHV